MVVFIAVEALFPDEVLFRQISALEEMGIGWAIISTWLSLLIRRAHGKEHTPPHSTVLYW
jgi:hypothetical protein